MTIRVGLVGAGIMGADHARVLSTVISGAALSAVSDVDPAKARAIADLCPGARALASTLEVIRDPAVDAVLVASPDATHGELVLACLAAGKPVLCEKPLAPTVDEGLGIVAREAALGRRLVTVGYMRRFDPGYVEMRRRLAAGELGRAYLLHCLHRNAVAPPYVTAATLITNAAVHELDAARFLTGREIRWIHAITRRAADLASTSAPQLLLMEMEDGTLVDAEVYMNARYGYDVRVEAVCERGTISLVAPHHVSVLHAGLGGHAFAADFRPRFAQAYRTELQAWIDSLRGGPFAGASAWDGYVATAAAMAGVRSLETGGPVEVKLAERPGLYGEA
jgi:myo-inositol 2-dehydrogenase/D-chiro-inositol 1-dehydrogenase